MSLRSFDEGDGGPRAGGPRPLKRPDSRGAEPRPGDRQASPGQRLPEDRGQIEERGGQDGANGTVDRLGRDHRSRRRGQLLGRLSATPIYRSAWKSNSPKFAQPWSKDPRPTSGLGSASLGYYSVFLMLRFGRRCPSVASRAPSCPEPSRRRAYASPLRRRAASSSRSTCSWNPPIGKPNTAGSSPVGSSFAARFFALLQLLAAF